MGDAGRASELLSSTDLQVVSQLAELINRENIARRELTTQLVAEAIAMAEAQGATQQPCLILHHRTWHLGLLGIISSKLVDLFHKPTIIFGGMGVLKGSARSIPGINIHEVIGACAEKIIEYGGHSCAAGLSLKEEEFHPFVAMANETLMRYTMSGEQQPQLNVDYIVTDKTEFADLEMTCAKLAPFGQGNPEPIFSTDRPCRLRNMQVIGKEKNHLRFSVFLADRWLDGVGFGFGSIAGQAVNGEAKLTLAFSLKENRFHGQTKPQVMLHDVLI
jgi:single-stranded-DNA-specific exonuclease